MDKKKVTIATHNSNFHADDVCAVAVLCLILEKENDITIVRTREPEIISAADYVVDVGGVYDESKNRFDHHQEGGAGGRADGILYSSLGLVWKKFGFAVSGSTEVADKIEKLLVEPIDAHDNGIQFTESKIAGLSPYSAWSAMYVFKPTWKETTNIDEVFLQMVSNAKTVIARTIVSYTDEKEAEALVIEAYNTAPDKRLVLLDARYPWEETLAKFPKALFVIHQRPIDGQWSLKTVRSDLNSYESRKNLPESWAGKRDAELEKVTGIPGAVFCHNGRFIAVAKTKEAILALAELALRD